MDTPADDRLALLAQLMAAEGFEAPEADATIVSRVHGGPVRAADAQELLWLLDRATPGLTAYNIPMAFRVNGPLRLDALEGALEALVARHEALRTTFAAQSEHPVLVVMEPGPVGMARLDVTGFPPDRREHEAERLVRGVARKPFDLGGDRLLRATAIRMAEDDHLLLIESHHIAVDGWSIGIILGELGQLYEGIVTERPADLPSLPIAYRDFVAWQREQLEGPRLQQLLDYWRAQLAAAPASLELPTDRPRANVPSFQGATVRRLVPPGVRDRLEALARKHGGTMYMALLAGYQAVLHRLSGQDEIVTGSASAGRTRPETEKVVGYFANTLAIRNSFNDDPTFEALLQRVREAALGAYDHQEIPLERLVLELRRDRSASHAPLYQCVLTMQDARPDAAGLALHGVTVAAASVDLGTTKFDLTLFPVERAEGIRLSLLYRTDLFEEDTAARFLGHLATLLDGAATNPTERVSRLPLLTPEERVALDRWNATGWDEGAATTVTALVQRHAERVPAQPAVVAGNGTLTWEALNTRANQLAHRLVGLDVGPGVTVGLCLDRSTDLVVALLGILKAGGAYVPLVPDLPAPRLAQQVSESAARLVVTMAAHRSLLPDSVAAICLDADAGLLARESHLDPAPRAGPDDLAYVLFTSGSTGVPKGVAVTHANLVHYTRAIARVLGLDLEGEAAPWQCATVSTLGADLGHTALFPALCSGGTVQIIPAAATTDGARFAAWAAEHPIDLLKITPNHFRALTTGEDLAGLLPRRWLVLGGEACPWDLAEEAVRAGRCRVLNHYGPTETTVGVCTHEVVANDPTRSRSATVPVGTPLANTRTYVREPRGGLAPVGVPGELFLGGAGVARGYLHRDDLTRERFVGDPEILGARLYRTGDRVRRLPSGDLEFLGRVDDQVKLRGYRVELGEIEAVLAAHPAVRQAAVLLRAAGGGEPELFAYVAGEAGLEPAVLRRHLAERMPEYMVPVHWVRLDGLPLSANGKVDRRALPLPAAEDPAAAASGAPQGEAEERLATLWAAVLKREAVGRHDDFFALGGHSLLAIRLLGRIAKEFGVRLPLRTLFDHPTVAALAPLLAAPAAESPGQPNASGAGITRRTRVALEPAPENPTG